MKKSKKSDNESYALLVTDMLNDFVNKGATLEVPAARAIIQPIRKEIDKARKAQIPIIYCCDAHKDNDPEFKLWPRHAVKGTAGADVIKQLKPHKEDYVISKTYYSCFYKTSLDKLLKKLDITHLILTGVVTNICILYTTAEAYMRGYKVTIPKNCVAALTKIEHRFALQQMQHVFHTEII
ncbi:MAG: cysteine hydrolase [Planctomycetes bacterium]|uniref:cysteine hydrolase family protein n=1 Tax=Candidatus Wunengus sp. YC65 TaxID=3367701 RepID=UPI001D3C0EE4|nr:cysteine hydrolase [Planctomycetota bacterium]